MSASARDTFLQQVRAAVHAGNRPGSAAPISPRGAIGYQGAGADPIERFRSELTNAGGRFHDAKDNEAAVRTIQSILLEKAARRVMVGVSPLLDRLSLADCLKNSDIDIFATSDLSTDAGRAASFAADVGISGVDFLIAETGSIALLTRPGQPRALSLLPPVHIAVAERTQLLPDLFDLFDELGNNPELPACVSLITGPSKTGDIELRLVTGVHGPGEVHVVLIAENRG